MMKVLITAHSCLKEQWTWWPQPQKKEMKLFSSCLAFSFSLVAAIIPLWCNVKRIKTKSERERKKTDRQTVENAIKPTFRKSNILSNQLPIND
jgi:hypothetical protein